MGHSLKQSVAKPTYLDFFGLTRPPFTRLAEPTQLFRAEQYSFLFEHLSNAAKHPDSLVVVCGGDGSGKSTLLNRYIASLGDDVFYVGIDDKCRDEESFYSAFLAQIGFKDISGTTDELRNITNKFVLYSGNAGDTILIIIDNAHLVNPIVLEQIRLISEIKIEGSRAISVILAGSPDLVRVVNAPAMSETKFHSTVVFNIRSYTEEETASYVWHRLRLAGGTNHVDIPHEAYPLIHRYSGGIPRLINTLCNDLLTEAYGNDSHVIDDKIIRRVADAKGLLPHVIPLHGKGRRKTDPDFSQLDDVAESEERIAVREAPSRESTEATSSGSMSVDPEYLLRHVSQLSEQVNDLRAEKIRAFEELEARNMHILELRDELNSRTAEIEVLSLSLASNTDEVKQLEQTASDTMVAKQQSEEKAKQLANLFEQETKAREALEVELAQAREKIDELDRRNQELLATVANLEGEVTAADARLAEIEVLEKNAADLQGEIQQKADELEALRKDVASRDESLVDLEMQLEESERECASAEQRIKALEKSEESEDVEQAVQQLAAELEQEKLARDAAESELATVTATADELSKRREELQASVADLQAELVSAKERGDDVDALKKVTADLKNEIEQLTGDAEKAQQQLAAELEQEKLARDTAESELATVTATADELKQRREELETSVADLQAELATAKERAIDVEALQQTSAELENQIAEKAGELDALRSELASRNQILADLEIRFEQSQSACELAQKRLLESKSPQEWQELEAAAEKLQSDLEQETRAKESAESELATATATVDELTQMNQELQASVRDMTEDVRLAGERVADFEVLKKSVGALQEEIKEKDRTLDLRDKHLADAKDQLAALKKARKRKTQRRRPIAPSRADHSVIDKKAATVASDAAPVYSSHVVDTFVRSISDVRAYQTLQAYDPKSYERLIDTYKKLIGLDYSEEQVINALRAKLATLIEKQLPRSSDAALIGYGQVVVDQLDEYLVDGTEPCFGLLVPNARSGNTAFAKYSTRTKDRELDTLDTTLRTYDADRKLPKEKDVWPDLEPIFARLIEEYGESNVMAIETPHDSSVDRALTCTIVKSLYSEILALPESKAANVLRWILSP